MPEERLADLLGVVCLADRLNCTFARAPAAGDPRFHDSRLGRAIAAFRRHHGGKSGVGLGLCSHQDGLIENNRAMYVPINDNVVTPVLSIFLMSSASKGCHRVGVGRNSDPAAHRGDGPCEPDCQSPLQRCPKLVLEANETVRPQPPCGHIDAVAGFAVGSCKARHAGQIAKVSVSP